MSKTLTKAITKLFKKWIVKRPHGMCQILFPLTELDDFVDEILAVVREREIAEKLPKGEKMTERGLYGKYVVAKADTMEVVDACFVLRPGKDMAARHAILMYAGYIGNQNPILASDLRAWVLSLPPLADGCSQSDFDAHNCQDLSWEDEMTDDKRQLRIGYDGPWNTEMETELHELLGKHGYECYESHCDLISGLRNLYFEWERSEDEAPDNGDDKCP